MAEHWSIYADWNPWHGCTKISPGCKYCYVYRQDAMYGSEIGSNLARKTAAFNLPVKRKRDRSWKIEPGKMVFTCFTSDFLLKDADVRRPFQLSQAHKANIDYKIREFYVPEKVKFEWKDCDYRQEELFL